MLNNHGGVIFGMIDGGSLPEANESFITEQSRSANLAEEFGINYKSVSSIENIDVILEEFFKSDGQAKIRSKRRLRSRRKYFYNSKKNKEDICSLNTPWKQVKEYNEIVLAKYEGIARISINRPCAYNAFTPSYGKRRTSLQLLHLHGRCSWHRSSPLP